MTTIPLVGTEFFNLWPRSSEEEEDILSSHFSRWTANILLLGGSSKQSTKICNALIIWILFAMAFNFHPLPFCQIAITCRVSEMNVCRLVPCDRVLIANILSENFKFKNKSKIPSPHSYLPSRVRLLRDRIVL